MHTEAAWEITSERLMPTGGFLKRAFDVVFALLLIVLFSPVFVVLIILMLLSSDGRIIYGHKRVGLNRREFTCYKFTTMVPNGDEVLQRHFKAFPEAEKEWEETRKLRNDPRVTPIGAVLRKLSLDELPQLVNILLGEMSIVGPRPVTRQELAMYGANSRYYLQTRPGLTGAWQISGRSNISYGQRVAMDTDYVRNWSFLIDFAIVLRTLPAVLLAKGSC
jgi:exopolysaccharide production protein ExoY